MARTLDHMDMVLGKLLLSWRLVLASMRSQDLWLTSTPGPASWRTRQRKGLAVQGAATKCLTQRSWWQLEGFVTLLFNDDNHKILHQYHHNDDYNLWLPPSPRWSSGLAQALFCLRLVQSPPRLNDGERRPWRRDILPWMSQREIWSDWLRLWPGGRHPSFRRPLLSSEALRIYSRVCLYPSINVFNSSSSEIFTFV